MPSFYRAARGRLAETIIPGGDRTRRRLDEQAMSPDVACGRHGTGRFNVHRNYPPGCFPDGLPIVITPVLAG